MNKNLASRYFISKDNAFSIFSRVVVWSLLLSVLYILRSFFVLIFLTFVFAYIQMHGVQVLEKRLVSRSLRVVVVGVVFLSIIISIILFLVPAIGDQATVFANKIPSYLQTLDAEIELFRTRQPLLDRIVPNDPTPAEPYSVTRNSGANGQVRWQIEKSKSVMIIQEMLGLGEDPRNPESIRKIIEWIRNVGGQLLAFCSAFLLSLLFSFLIVLDFPVLAKRVRHLRRTKLSFIYREVSGGMKTFASVLGQTLEAQVFIALCNTILTALIIYYLGLQENLAFLSLIVFICSFIPVAGVFISSVPICILTLIETGFHNVLIAIFLIILVHMVETYILNPKIFGQRLHLNPVIVLIILTIAGKLFHVWGLILGLPMFTYFFGYAIQLRPSLQSRLSNSKTKKA